MSGRAIGAATVGMKPEHPVQSGIKQMFHSQGPADDATFFLPSCADRGFL